MKNYKVTYLVGLAMLAMGLQVSQGVILQTWNLGSDFSITNGNPNNLNGGRAGSSWSYGLTPNSGSEPVPSSFALLPFGTNSSAVWGAPLAGIEGWSYTSGDPNPAIMHNPTGSTISGFGIVFNPNDVVFGTYHGTQHDVTAGSFWVDARWTAPVAGSYVINAFFQNDQDPGATPMRIYENTTPVFSATTANPNGSLVSYAGELQLLAGDKLDFAVKSTGSAYRVFANIDLVPEPTSLALLVFSSAVFAARFRRRS